MYKIPDKIINFITNAMENLRLELTAGRQTLAGVKVFQGDSLLLRILQIYKTTEKD